MKVECEVCGSDIHVNIEEAAPPSGYMILEISEPVVTMNCVQDRSHIVSPKMRNQIINLLRKNKMI